MSTVKQCAGQVDCTNMSGAAGTIDVHIRADLCSALSLGVDLLCLCEADYGQQWLCQSPHAARVGQHNRVLGRVQSCLVKQLISGGA